MTINNSEKIINAAVELLKEKIYDDITIKDICAGCGISRQTFYNYFKNKDEVYKEFFRRLSLTSSLFSPSRKKEYLFSREYIKDVVDFYDEFSEIILSLENQNILWYLGKDLINYHKSSIIATIDDEFLLKNRDYYYTFITSTVSFICLKWIRKGKPETKEELMEIIQYIAEFKPKSR